MSRRKQTNPRAIKRDVSHDEDENGPSIPKKLAVESNQSDSIDSTVTIEDEPKSNSIECDNCEENFASSEQFNQHRLHQCSLLTETTSDESRTSSSFEEFPQPIDTIPYGTSQTEEYPHACSYCQKTFSNMALLLKHEQVHVELMPFRCSFCGKGFKHRRSLNRHSKLHTGERKFKCTVCESTFARSDHLKAHIRTHTNNNNHHHHHQSIPSVPKTAQVDFPLKVPFPPNRTDFDSARPSSETKLNKDEHRAEHCPYCPRICLGEESLRSHLQIEHHQNLDDLTKIERETSVNGETYCYLCNAKFNNVENYYAHLRCTHPTVRLSKSSLFSGSMQEEQLFSDYALVEKTICCEKCQRSFDSMTMYLQHYSFQHCLQIIKCLQCQDVFETIESFFNHIEKIHPSKTVENFKCKLCNATYKHRTDFLHHLQTVHKLSSSNSSEEFLDHLTYRPSISGNDTRRSSPSFNALFSCKFCPMKLNSRFDLNHHILHEHHDERQEKKFTTPINSMENRCFHCEATFASESLLNEHLKSVHRSSISPSSSVSFKCLYCHTSFTSRAQLERHARIHVASSGTNLKCNICDRQFPTIDLLSEHKLSHCKATTSNLCSVCHQKIENEEDYIRHFYDHHQGNSPTKSKGKLFNVHQTDSTPITIACVICKQSLINEREIDLHAKFHLTKSKLKMNCSRCHRTSINDGNFLLDLSTWNSVCFPCLAKELNLSDAFRPSTAEFFSCPKCRSDLQFDNVKTFHQHFTSLHSNSPSDEEFHCLKCNKIVSSREHISEHRSNSSFLIDAIELPRSSSPPRVHYCYLCRTNFDTAMKMHLHLIDHQYPNGDYQCELCTETSFDDANQLYHHMVQHGSKARLYPCRECDVYFMFSMHLINHQSSHNDESNNRTGFLTTKLNENNIESKSSFTSKLIENSEKESISSKSSMITRSSSKGTTRSVTVS